MDLEPCRKVSPSNKIAGDITFPKYLQFTTKAMFATTILLSEYTFTGNVTSMVLTGSRFSLSPPDVTSFMCFFVYLITRSTPHAGFVICVVYRSALGCIRNNSIGIV